VAVRLATAGVPVDGGPGVPVGWGVHQNQPSGVPLPLRSSTKGSWPVSSPMSSTMRGSTGRKTTTGQVR
jgi:hypothetical protein